MYFGGSRGGVSPVVDLGGDASPHQPKHNVHMNNT